MARPPNSLPPGGPVPAILAPPTTLGAAEIAAYLTAHPDFLDDQPHLIPLITPPRRRLGDNILDLQQYMLEHLRTETARLKLQQRALIATSRSNLTSQQRVHAASLAIMAATDAEALIHCITQELSLVLDVDVVALCIEARHIRRSAAPGTVMLTEGTVDRLIGQGNDTVLKDHCRGDALIFGAAAGLVRSKAFLRLTITEKRRGIMALGSRRSTHFKPGQGTELLGYLAQVVSIRLAHLRRGPHRPAASDAARTDATPWLDD